MYRRSYRLWLVCDALFGFVSDCLPNKKRAYVALFFVYGDMVVLLISFIKLRAISS